MGAFHYHIETLLVWLLLCTISLKSVTCSMKVRCSEKDMSTLLHFKQGVTDPAGLLSSSWLPQNDCCKWEGVQCDNITGRVTELSLPCHTIPPVYGDKDDKSHCLTGELDLSLLDLEFLSHLDLSNNDFKRIRYNPMRHQACNDLSKGTHPFQCQNSSNLRYLDLSYNDGLLVDNLRWISTLSFLQHLDLSSFDLHSETDWLHPVTLLPSLSELFLYNCQLHNIYPSLQYANFTSLQVLNFGDNDFVSELPPWIFNLSCGISVIDLSDNYIHGQLPKTLPNLSSLKRLVLSGNNMDGPIPDWFGQLDQLQRLYLDDNSFSGQIPTSLGNLSSLNVLNLNFNDLNGILPESLGELFNLEALQVADNSLTGNISERNFHSLSNLKFLELRSPALIFDFDLEWTPPFQLLVMWLGYVTPKLPSWLHTQTSLKALTIMDSRVSFEPLDKFWNFAAQLDHFSLTNNSINADMSNVLLNSKICWLDQNNLMGGVPQLSPNVTLLVLFSNSLSGSIAPLLCHKMKGKSNLKYLDISDNTLSGEIPNCWIHWESLLHVNLENNNLIGKIPHSMGSLSNLISLNLNGNELSGEVTHSFKNCKNLWILNLGENKFSGAIPRWMGQSVKALLLRSNQFSGNIPANICQLHSLKILDFANNRLSGPIPNCLHNMTSMIAEYGSIDEFFISIHVLNKTKTFTFNLALLIKGNELTYSSSMYAIDFSSNSLSGTIPSELFVLARLQSLNMSHNHLVGMISQDIGSLKQLESLDLSSNRLSGQIPESMSDMNFLEVLNLSFNNFMGKIPSGTQLQGFTNLSYMGNPKLCGSPLTKNCRQDENFNNTNPITEHDDESEVHSWFYMGLGIGFATGFWGVLGVIFFNRKCRHAYFKIFGRLYEMVILKIEVYLILKMTSSRWNFKNRNNGN